MCYLSMSVSASCHSGRFCFNSVEHFVQARGILVPRSQKALLNMGQAMSRWYETTLFDGAMELFESNTQRKLRQRLFQYMDCDEPTNTTSVLEIGAGAGLNLPHYPVWVKELHASSLSPDLPPKAKKRARKRNIKVYYKQGKPIGLPYPENSFDYVVATLILCSLPDREGFVKEIYRVLKPGGKYLFMDHAWQSAEAQTHLSRMLAPLHRRLALGCSLKSVWADSVFTSAGFKREDLHVEEEIPKGFSWLVGKIFLGYATKRPEASDFKMDDRHGQRAC